MQMIIMWIADTNFVIFGYCQGLTVHSHAVGIGNGLAYILLFTRPDARFFCAEQNLSRFIELVSMFIGLTFPFLTFSLS